ncbi:uncharacterized protein SCHCODRAFT_01122841, partial [Schizophyllum commune H4-8]|uniref:uncharacterized protein n=1 Tax=Schizophyllum commune (strain H4-8 / FGSC 9210) TaxID=578458 RepID=UPI0021606A65
RETHDGRRGRHLWCTGGAATCFLCDRHSLAVAGPVTGLYSGLPILAFDSTYSIWRARSAVSSQPSAADVGTSIAP